LIVLIGAMMHCSEEASSPIGDSGLPEIYR
jgi:hypothetical protein